MTKELSELVLEQSKTGFLNRAKRAVGRGLSILALPVILGVSSLVGCKPYVIPNQPPTYASLNANPSSGPVPLEVNLESNVDDPDGIEDIVEYETFADYNGNGLPEKNESLHPPQSTPPQSATLTQPGNYNLIQVSTDSVGHKIQASSAVNPSAVIEPPVEPPVVPPVGDDYIEVNNGKVEDSEKEEETPLPLTAFVNFYDEANQSVPIRIKEVRDGTTKIDDYTVKPNPNDGKFSVTLDKLVNPADEIFLYATMGTTATPTSYTGGLSLSATDHTNLSGGSNVWANPAVRVVPYFSDLDGDGFDDLDRDKNGLVGPQEKTDFRKHLAEVLTGGNNSILGDPLLQNPEVKRWNFNDPNFKIVIMETNGDGPASGFFSNISEDIIDRYTDQSNPDYIGDYHNDQITLDKIITLPYDENSPYSERLPPHPRAIIFIEPDSTIVPGVIGYTYGPYSENGIYYAATIKIKTDTEGRVLSSPGFDHESGHSIGQEGHAETYDGLTSIMRAVISTSRHTGVDRKVSKIINQKTYTKNNLNNILIINS